jgi:hypothetical protein
VDLLLKTIDGFKKSEPEQPDSAAAQQAARDALTNFEKPGWTWKTHMECLMALAKAGPEAVPVLAEAFKTGSPASRALAEALGFLADEKVRPAIEKLRPELLQAVEDKDRDAQVAAFYEGLFGHNGADVQLLEVALNVYATTSSLGGNAGVAYGFTVSATGLGARSFNVGADGAPVGVANNTTLNVYELLRAVNQRASGGVLYGGDASLQQQAADLFDALNQARTIGYSRAGPGCRMARRPTSASGITRTASRLKRQGAA